jgi:hypothetical protein
VHLELYLYNKPRWCTMFSSYYVTTPIHVSVPFVAHHQEGECIMWRMVLVLLLSRHILILYFHLCLGHPSDLLCLDFQPKISTFPSSKSSAWLHLISLILLLKNYSLCNFLYLSPHIIQSFSAESCSEDPNYRLFDATKNCINRLKVATSVTILYNNNNNNSSNSIYISFLTTINNNKMAGYWYNGILIGFKAQC